MEKLTSETICAALEKCAALEDCAWCVIWDQCHGQMIVCSAAAERIRELEAKVAKAGADIHRVGGGEEECAVCKNRANIDAGKCEEADWSCSSCAIADCVCRHCNGNNSRFEWEGLNDEQK